LLAHSVAVLEPLVSEIPTVVRDELPLSKVEFAPRVLEVVRARPVS